MDVITKIFEFLTQYKLLISVGLYLIILLPVIFKFIGGMRRGFRLAAWKLVLDLVTLLLFIFTLNAISEAIFTMKLFSLPAMLEEAILNSHHVETETIKDLSARITEAYLSNVNGINADTVYTRALIDSVFLFSVKLIWMTLYFSIIVPIIRLILRLLIFNTLIRPRKEYTKITRDPLLGGMTGLLRGLVRSFVLMVALSGIFTLLSYDGNLIESSKSDNTAPDSAELSTMSNVLFLSDEEPETPKGSNSLDGLKDILKEMKPLSDSFKIINDCWKSNVLVKAASSIYFEKEEGLDELGDKVYKKTNLLNFCFDEIVYMEYKVEDDEVVLDFKINLVEDVNNLIQAAMYIIDDENVIKSDGSLDLTKVDSAKVESAFNYLSDVKMMKAMLIVIMNLGIEVYKDQITAVDLTDRSFQNKLYSTDFTKDLSTLGKFVGGLFELGLGDALNDYLIDGKQFDAKNIDAIVSILKAKRIEGETDAEFKLREEESRKKVEDSAKNLNIINIGGPIISGFLVNSMLNSFVEQYGLNDEDINKLTGESSVSYKDKLINEIDLGKDLSTIFKILFDASDYNGDNSKLKVTLDRIWGTDTTSELDFDDAALFINQVFANLANVSFIQSSLDIGIKIVSKSLSNNEKIGKYLTDTNIFSSYIDWKEEIGENIPNIVTAILTCGIFDELAEMKNDGKDLKNIMNVIDGILFKEGIGGEENVLTSMFEETVKALFDLKVLSNLEDTCLKPLLTDLVQSMSSSEFELKISDNLGVNKSFEEETILFLNLFDEIVYGAKLKGATSVNELTSNTNYLIGAIENVDSLKLESSSIIAPTVINLLCKFENDMLQVPYIYGDPKWYSVYSGDTLVSYGELHNAIEGIKSASSLIIDIMDSSSSLSTTSDYLNLIKDLDDSVISKLFDSVTIKATVSKLLGDTSEIKTPSSVKEDVIVSKYSSTDDVTSTGLSFDLLEDGTTVTREYVSKKMLKKDEIVSLVHAAKQLDDIDSLLDNDKLLDTIISLSGDATDGHDHSDSSPYESWVMKNETELFKKSDVLLESDIIRCTISSFLTGDDYNSDVFKFPVNTVELDVDKYYITKEETKKFVNSAIKLVKETGISSLDSISESLIDKIVSLPDDAIDEIVDSNILLMTISDKITTIDALSIPVSKFDRDGNDYYAVKKEEILPIVSGTPKDAYKVEKEEFKNLLKALKLAFPGTIDLNSIDVTSIFDNLLQLAHLANMTVSGEHKLLNDFTKSEILNTTLTDKLIGIDNFKVPYSSVSVVTKLTYDNGSKTYNEESSYAIKDAEIKTLLKSLEYIFPYKNGGLGSNDLETIDYESIIGDVISLDKGTLTKLFSSEIVNATMSKTAVNSSVLLVPKSLTNEIYYMTKDSDGRIVKSSDYIYEVMPNELVQAVSSLSYVYPDTVNLNNINLDSLTDMLNLSQADLDEMLSSEIIRLTFSKQLYNTSSIVIPTEMKFEVAETKRIISKPVEVIECNADIYSTGTYYEIDENEFSSFLKSIKYIFDEKVNISDISMDLFKSLSTLSAPDLDEFSSSAIINATISNKLKNAFSASSDYKIIIPEDVLTPYRTKNLTSLEDDILMVSKSEIKNIISAMQYFDFDNLGSSDDAYSTFKSLSDNASDGYSILSHILKSRTMQATLSNIVLNMTTDTMNIVAPSTVLESTSYHYFDETSERLSSSNAKIIKIDEINALANGIGYIESDQISLNGNDTFNAIKGFTDYLSLTSDVRKIDLLNESLIIRATISNYLLKMTGAAIDIDVPMTNEVLESNGSTPIEFDNVSKYNQNKIYILTKTELKKFVFGISSLDTTKLTTDIQTSVLSLNDISPVDSTRKVIDVISDSLILRVSISNYLFEKSSNLGINSGISFPKEVIDGNDTDVIKLLGDGTFSTNERYYIDQTELNQFIESISLIDLENIGTNTMVTLKKMSTDIDDILSSKILLYTLSNEVQRMAVNGTDWVYVLPENSYEREGLLRKNAYILDLSVSHSLQLTNKSVNVLKKSEIVGLIDVLGKYDIESMTSSELLMATESDIDNLLASNIFYATIASKFKESIDSNATYGTYYLPEMEDTSVEYRTQPNSLVTLNPISKMELKNIHTSMKLLGASNLSDFNITADTIANFPDDGDNSNDDGYNGNDDLRAIFMKSDFIRNIISKAILSSPVLLNSSSISNTIDSNYSTTYTTTLLNKIPTYNSVSGVISYDEPTINGLDLGDTVFKYYRIMIDGDVIANANIFGVSFTTNELSYDISSLVRDEVGNHSVYVVAVVIVIHSGLPQIVKPVNYTRIDETVEANLINVNPAINNGKVEFAPIPHADKYEISFYDSNDSLVKTVEAATKSSVSVDLLKELAPDKYYFKIKASSNNTAFVSSTIDSRDSSLYYEVGGTLDKITAEINEGILYFKPVSNAESYKVTIDGTVYQTPHDIQFISAANIYYMNLSNKVSSSGLYNVEIKAIGNEFYSESVKTLDFANISNDITISYDESGNKINLSKVDNADRYNVIVYRLENGTENEMFYKELTLTSTGTSISTSTLKKGYNYKVKVTPTTSKNGYYSAPKTETITINKTISTPYYHRIDNDMNLSFKFDPISDTFTLKLYDFTDELNPVLLSEKTANTSNVDLYAFFDDISWSESVTYKVTVTAKLTNTSSEFYGIYNDSLESCGKTFKLNKVDKVYDLGIVRSSSEEYFTFTEIENVLNYRIVLEKKEYNSLTDSYDYVALSNGEITINANEYEDGGIISFDIDEIYTEGQIEASSDSKSNEYRIKVYALSYTGKLADSDASKTVSFCR